MRIYFFNLFQFPGVYFICCIFYRICTQIFWITLIVTRGKESRFQLSIIKLFHVPRPTLIDIYRKCTTSYSASFDADYWLNGLLLDRLLPRELPRDNVSTMCVKARLTWSKNEGLCHPPHFHRRSACFKEIFVGMMHRVVVILYIMYTECSINKNWFMIMVS